MEKYGQILRNIKNTGMEKYKEICGKIGRGEKKQIRLEQYCFDCGVYSLAHDSLMPLLAMQIPRSLLFQQILLEQRTITR